MSKWYEDHKKLAAFVRALAIGGMGAKSIAYLVEKPWKWTAEYELWLQIGSPLKADPDDLTERVCPEPEVMP